MNFQGLSNYRVNHLYQCPQMHLMLFLYCWKPSCYTQSDWKNKKPEDPVDCESLSWGLAPLSAKELSPLSLSCVSHCHESSVVREKKKQRKAMVSPDKLTACQLAPRSRSVFWILICPLCLLSWVNPNTCALSSATIQISFITATSSDILSLPWKKPYTLNTISKRTLTSKHFAAVSFDIWTSIVFGSWQCPIKGSHMMSLVSFLFERSWVINRSEFFLLSFNRLQHLQVWAISL